MTRETLGSSKTRRGRALLAVGVAGIMLAATGCGGGSSTKAAGSGSSGAKDLGTLKVVTVVPHSLLFMGVEAAERLGTWDGTGLKVEVIDGTSETVGQTMAAGKGDIGLGEGNRAASNIQKGLDASIMATCISPWAQYIIAGTKSGATKVEDLKGKTFGTSGVGSAGDYSVYKMGQALGWNTGDYKTVPLGKLDALRAALASGSIDSFAWSSTTAFALESKGQGKVLTSARDYVGPTVFEAFSVMNPVAQQRPKAVKAFFDGYFKAVKKMQSDPALVLDILTKDWNVDPAAAQKAIDADLKNISTDGTINEAELKGLAASVNFSTKAPIANPDSLYKPWGNLKG